VMRSLQGFWSLGGLIGAAFSSLLLRRHASARLDLGVAAVAMIVTTLVSRLYLLPEDAAAEASIPWTLIPRHLWALAAVAFLSLFIEGAIGDWGTVFLRSTLHVSAATGFAAFSLSMMTGCFIGDYLNMKLGATNLALPQPPVSAIWGFWLDHLRWDLFPGCWVYGRPWRWLSWLVQLSLLQRAKSLQAAEKLSSVEGYVLQAVHKYIRISAALEAAEGIVFFSESFPRLFEASRPRCAGASTSDSLRS
jgi:hypothetical protein